MRSFFQLWILIALFSLTACEEDACASNQDERCQDLPQSGACLAAFQSWFYNSQPKQCVKLVFAITRRDILQNFSLFRKA